jgi:probable phosphoglycerate mutase
LPDPSPIEASPTTVVFVRHAHTHNPREVIYARLPRFRLSLDGREAADRTARYLADWPIAAIYTSPLLRARQTAARIAALHPGVPVHQSSWLMEVRTAWEGDPLALYDQVQNFTFYNPKGSMGGESIWQVFARMDRAMRMVLHRHPGQTTVCVSHGDPIKMLYLVHSGITLTPQAVKVQDPPRAGLVIFRFQNAEEPPAIETFDPETGKSHDFGKVPTG